ncbi:hypothetical protein [Baekduia sp. Peel2402]|uniref:hypothetical protein n=1 Tax=Baekduia sp. Peel2402 TaxID=3458296 RepID=UPI00403E3F09
MTQSTEHRIDVAVTPGDALAARPRLFAALQEAFPVRFAAQGDVAPDAPLLAFAPAGGPLPDAAALGAPGRRAAFAVMDGDAPGAAEPVTVDLADAPAVEPSVRGIALADRVAAELTPAPGEQVLAAAGAAAVWTEADGVHRVAAVLPELADDEVLYALLSRRAIASVALVHFLRAICGSAITRRRPRAAFVFDDPNLRWRSYGFIDYRALVAHADMHGYHVVMAMIPLDAAARAHRATAQLFIERRDRLSLVVHGNDHVHNELLAQEDEALALATAAQALRRVERFERRSGVPVDHIMMPPHGRCSRAMARALAAVGFDALSAIHPLPWTAERPAEPPLAAWRPADFVGGCAVIPRTPLTSTVADLALRAFLDHPMIVYGHHEDVAGGLDSLAEAAARVNRVGDVEWLSVGEIARGSFDARTREDGTLVVRPFSGRVALDAPAAAVTVEEPPQADGEHALAGWSADGGPLRAFGEVGEGRELRLHPVGAVDAATVAAPAWRPWPKLRRTSTEVRDRVLALKP